MSDWKEALPGVTEVLAEHAARHDRDGSFPVEGIQAIHEAGLLTVTVHGRYGGIGGGLADTATILRALGQGDPSAALITAMTMFAHGMQGLAPTWPEDLYAAVLREAAD